jgi:S-formylglutathione hydrolase FrmB
VLVPKRYASHASITWPVVYVLGVGGSNYAQNLELASLVAQMTSAPNVPQMIWVFLNYSTITGTTEFVDSVNNGPWETALMRELIPALEKRFRMDARPSGRFLTGHSSGGWASLWLELRHPDFFSGAWATAPDPVDFHDFVGVDLYAPGANMYFDAHHQPRPLVRYRGKVLASLRDWVRLEEVLGHVGGTFQSFDWVFSPRAPDGSAMPMFNRVTGAVDPAVADYWETRYDIARQIGHMSSGTRRALAGKLHVTVGDQDTFYLNGAVEKLRAVLRGVGIPATIRILPGKTHNNLYGSREDPLALLRAFAGDMYAIARPARSKSSGGLSIEN